MPNNILFILLQNLCSISISLDKLFWKIARVDIQKDIVMDYT